MSSQKDEELSEGRKDIGISGPNEEAGLILDKISDAFILLDADWNLTYVNEQAEIIFKNSRRNLLGKNLLKDFPGIVGTEFETQYKEIQRTGLSSCFECFYVPYNIWIEVRAYPIPNGYLMYYKDISERKKKEIFWNIGENLLWNLSTSDTINAAFEKVLQTIVRNTPWTFGQIWRLKDDHVFIHERDPFVAASEKQLNFRKASSGKQFSVKEGILKEVNESGELYFIPDLKEDQRLKRKDAALEAGFRSWLGIPIKSNGIFYEVELLSERVLSREEACLDILSVISKRFAEIISVRVADQERKTFIELSLDMILAIDSEGNIQKANSSFRKILGYDRKSIKSKNIYDYMYPDDIEHTKAEIYRIVKDGGGSSGFENRFVTKDGEIRSLFWNSVVSPNSGTIFCVGRDKTDDKIAREKLESFADELTLNKDQLQNAQKIAKLGSWTMEFDRKLHWSPELYEIFGIDKSEPPPNFSEFIKFVHPEDRDRIAGNYKKFVDEGIFEETELKIQSKDGKDKHLMVRGEILLNKDGILIGSSGTMQDITEQKEWNDSIRQFQKMEAVGQLAGGMAHDFNNLLNIILANLDLLELNLRNSPDLLKRVLSAQDAVRRGADVNRRLLAFSRRQAINPEVADIVSVIKDFAPVLTRIRNDQTIMDFSFEEFPLFSAFERNGLENALLNMGINSRDALLSGGRILVSASFAPAGTEHRSIAPGLLEMGDACLISVRDEGAGMDTSTRERIFEPFFTTKVSGKGTGLGMPMVYAFVKQSGGSIHVHSEPGKGTQVDILLPLVGKAPESWEVVSGETPAKKIVVVEKSLKWQLALSALLKRAGYEILLVYDIYELKAVLDTYPDIFAVFAEEEIVFNTDEFEEWDILKKRVKLITILEWNSAVGAGDPLYLKRPYSWTKIKNILHNPVSSKRTI